MNVGLNSSLSDGTNEVPNGYSNVGAGDGMDVGLSSADVGLNKTEKAVIGLLMKNANNTAEMLASEIGVTKRTVERAFASLQKKGKLKRIGSKRDGYWAVISK